MEIRSDVYREIITDLKLAERELLAHQRKQDDFCSTITMENALKRGRQQLEATKPHRCPSCGKEHAQLWAGGSCFAPHRERD